MNENHGKTRKANKLATSTSPYLRQHQFNPVEWHPWSPEALDTAKRENKLTIVSIGYSTCHWCHVMERESFENDNVADLMNQHFISIKIDREENPDLDQLYMTAVQLMSGRGGWPLNCICLPDGRPIYGGTYFPKEAWINILDQLQELWQNDPQTAINYADKLAAGIVQSERLPIYQGNPTFRSEQLEEIIQAWKKTFDPTDGGTGVAPKFPMPDNWDFLLQYGHLYQDNEILDQVHLTLHKIGSGGIYDQIGGGFARYSVDEKWHIPHFEKMLYDNAQLVSLYLQAWLQKPDPLYRQIVEETLDWCTREMKGSNGGYYSALDADSEGVEGKFYIFDSKEIDEIFAFAPDQAETLKKYYHISEQGNWEEEESNVLYTNSSYPVPYFLTEAKASLLAYRNKRIKPSLDDKQLCSWNAMLIKAFVQGYQTFGNSKYLEEALGILNFIENELELKQTNGILLRKPLQERTAIPGFLEDYAHYALALLQVYEATFDEKHLYKAKKITDYVLENFLDEEETFFYFTHKNSPVLIARKQETQDNVIPSSNSVMMLVLDQLGLYFDEPTYGEISARALASMLPQLSKYGPAYANWSKFLLRKITGTQEIILSGKTTMNWKKDIYEKYTPLTFLLGGSEPSEIPILKNKTDHQDLAYLCQNKSCSLPLKTREELLLLLNFK